MTDKKKIRTALPLGFTLIETLMAILILSVSIAGPLTIASRGLNAALASKNRTTAFYLAQDAMEFVRYKRDSNCLTVSSGGCTGAAWLTTLSGTAGNNGCVSADGSLVCDVDSIQGTVIPCSSGTCEPLNYKNSAYFYTHASISSPTIVQSAFTRTVRIITPVCHPPGSTTVPCNADEAQVSVTVSWLNIGTATTKPSVTIQEEIFNWQ